MKICKRPGCGLHTPRPSGYCDGECEALHERDIAEDKLAEAERQRDEAVKLLREWGGPSPYRDAAGTLTPMIEHVRDLTERTEAYLAGVQHE